MPVEASYLTAFIAGLLGGVHCLGMCGGIVGALTFGIKNDNDNSNKLKQFPYLLAYNSGRIFSYTLAGTLVGGISMLAANLTALRSVQYGLEVLAALFMIVLGLYLAGWWNGLRRVEQAGGFIWKHVEPISRKFIPVSSPTQALILGALWGWLPCGLVYTILFWSITTGSALEGGLLMLSFGLGTLPMLLAMGVFAAALSGFIQKRWVRITAGSMIIAFGVFSLFNIGLRLQV